MSYIKFTKIGFDKMIAMSDKENALMCIIIKEMNCNNIALINYKKVSEDMNIDSVSIYRLIKTLEDRDFIKNTCFYGRDKKFIVNQEYITNGEA